MEAKKSKKIDLKSMQSMFMQIGLVVALGLVFVAFQWATPYQNEIVLSGMTSIDYEPELIPVTRPEKPKVKEAPLKKALKLVIIEGPIDFEEANIDFTSEGGEEIYIEPISLDWDDGIMEADTFVIVEDMPVFPGGRKALLRYIASETKYPRLAKINGVQGSVFVQFIINKQGMVKDAKVIRSADELLDNEALRVILTMPKWKPGEQRGKPVNVQYVIPFSFKLLL